MQIELQDIVKLTSLLFHPVQADVQVPALAPYLDLSLVKSITYIDVEGDYFQPGFVCAEEADLRSAERCDPGVVFVPHRLLPPGATGPMFVPLSIHSLHVQLLFDTDTDSALWLFFDPVVARFEGTPARSAKEPTIFEGPNLYRWTRLRELSLVDAVTDGLLFNKGHPGGPLALTYELSIVDKGASAVSFVVEDAHGPDDDDSDLSSSISQIIIQVATEAMKTAFLDGLVSSPLLDRTTVVVKPDPAAEA